MDHIALICCTCVKLDNRARQLVQEQVFSKNHRCSKVHSSLVLLGAKLRFSHYSIFVVNYSVAGFLMLLFIIVPNSKIACYNDMVSLQQTVTSAWPIHSKRSSNSEVVIGCAAHSLGPARRKIHVSVDFHAHPKLLQQPYS